jgi:hypothetical protein
MSLSLAINNDAKFFQGKKYTEGVDTNTFLKARGYYASQQEQF